ncbi:rhamnose ABC transporter substrate-binding protein [Lachnoclostridium sp. Marseille-P6806]|uniref:rhamnose ABC transporter substrate-binding protein n=1 Tax=Lachnoclostridium sp. Marseille-P6806 TaxID=2364793 RepID=UPI0010309D0C|nr:rhamnose ABC transporter substrate-binding protein [Lachnoclostridium sp. Marseille-P6806]
MKKKLISVLVSAGMIAALLAGCGSSTPESSPASSGAAAAAEPAESADTAATDGAAETSGSGAAGHTYAIVTKAAGNPYMERMSSGFQGVIEAAGGTCIVQNPEAATADAQISVIQSLISQGVDSIAVAANDANALTAALTEAKDAGIQVLTLDSDVNAAARRTFCNQAGIQEVGQALIDAVYDLTGGKGQYAILSATSQATNQNAWIDAMKTIAENDDKYSGLELVEVAYGDDEPQKSTDQTQALLQNYPELKVICAPTTVGISAAAKVLQDQKSSVKLTGLGLPSEMAEYIGSDGAHSCPYMFLWNPIDLGKLAAYTSIALVDGTITGKAGDSFEAGDMENSPYTVTDMSDGTGTEIILGPPFRFDPDNIAEWAEVY